MTGRIWFIPSTRPHVHRYDALLDALEHAGFDVRLLCVDAAHVPAYKAIDLVSKTGRPFETLAVPGYQPPRHWFWRRRGRKRLIRALHAFLDAAAADVLLFPEDTSELARTFLRVAREAGVRTVLVPDGLVVPSNPAFRPSRELRIKHWFSVWIRRAMGTSAPRGTGEVDLLLLLNRSGFDELRKRGVPESRMQVVGSAEHERLAARYASGEPVIDATEVRHRLGLSPGQRMVAYFEQPTTTTRAQLEALVQVMYAAASECEAGVLVKIHPRSPTSVGWWSDWARERYGPDHLLRFAANECNSVEALGIASLCVTVYSTVAIEALILECPMVLVDYLNQPFKLPYGQDRRAALEADSPEALHAAIVQGLTDESLRKALLSGAREVLAEELGGLDGSSTARSVELIGKLVEQHRGR